MYSVFIRNDPEGEESEIHSPYVNNLKVYDARVVKDVDSINSFLFSIFPNHEYFNELKPFKTFIEVWNVQENKRVFKGRLLDYTDRMDSNGAAYKDMTCEGELAYLHDSVQDYGRWQNMTPREFFTELIKVHNAQVEEYKRFEIGEVNVTNSTDNVYRYTDDSMDTYETIKDKLIDRIGGELQVRYEDNRRFIDYVIQTGSKGNQKIELTKNLRSFSRKIDPSELITVLKPLGERIENEEGITDASAPRVTIESVNNGSPFLEDTSKMQQFGIKRQAMVWEDISDPSILLRRGREFLQEQKTTLNQYQVTALDLAPLELDVDSFENGWTYDTYNPLLGIDEELRVVGQTVYINDPAQSSLTIGDKLFSQEEFNQALLKSTRTIEEVRNETRAQARTIQRLRDDITLKVETLETQLSEIDTSGIPALEEAVDEIISAVLELSDVVESIELPGLATEETDGLLSSMDKQKLNRIEVDESTNLNEMREKLQLLQVTDQVDLNQLVADVQELMENAREG